MLACAHPGMQRTGDAVTSILPAGIRLGHESASLLRAVEGGPQGTVLVCNGAVQRSDGKRRQIQILIHSVTREGATDAAGGFLMPLCPYCR